MGTRALTGTLMTRIHKLARAAPLLLLHLEGIVHGQGLRYRRIINDDDILKRRLSELSSYFRNCGYPDDLIKPIFDKIANMERCLEYNSSKREQPFITPFLYTYGPGKDTIKNYIDYNVNNALKAAQSFSNIEVPIIKTVFKKPNSLRSLLFNQKKVVIDSGSDGLSERCTSVEEAQHRRGPKCMTCPMMSGTNTFVLNNSTFNECIGGTCKSNNIIYLAQCILCNKGYFGKTTTPLHKRFNNHRTSVDPKNLPTEVTDEHSLAIHSLIDHQNQRSFNELFKLFVVKSPAPKDLKRTEQLFVNRFNTLRPVGLNIDNPIGLRMLRVHHNHTPIT